MSSGTAWFPFYIGDYHSDTLHLSCEQHGAYVLLMLAYYRQGHPLDDDNTSLAGIAKLTHRKWLAMRPVLARFFQIKEGLWRHKRIDAEIAEQHARHDERSRSGAKGAASRERNRGKPRDTSQAEHKAQPKTGKTDETAKNNDTEHEAEHEAQLDEPLPKTQRLPDQNQGKLRAKIKHTSQVERIDPYEFISFYQHTRDATPSPLPSLGDGAGAALREGQEAGATPPPERSAEADAAFAVALHTLRAKMGLLDSDAGALPLPDPRIVEHRARMNRINTFVGERLNGEDRTHGWEVLAEANGYADPNAIPPPLAAALAAIEALAGRAEAAE